MDPRYRRSVRGLFDTAAASYSAARPSYPAEAVQWLLHGDEPDDHRTRPDVLDLGAGAGALTAVMLGHTGRLTAAEPSINLLRELRTAVGTGVGRRAEAVHAVRAGAESLPFEEASFDVVTVATAFHWFDPLVALPEIARVLRPDGVLALVWNTRAVTTSLAKGLEALLRGAQPDHLRGSWGSDSAAALDDTAWFTPPERASFDHVQLLDRRGLVDLTASRSYVIAMAPAERAGLLDRVGELFDRHAGSRGTVELPYEAQCWRSLRR